jgi:hypothetical protein
MSCCVLVKHHEQSDRPLQQAVSSSLLVLATLLCLSKTVAVLGRIKEIPLAKPVKYQQQQ